MHSGSPTMSTKCISGSRKRSIRWAVSRHRPNHTHSTSSGWRPQPGSSRVASTKARGCS
ncbi:UNVERIFIED_CONTAM: hypothetical protein GTU68_014634 [Idotea baltica]|nr:hypothetical protein [Idotea baltica]